MDFTCCHCNSDTLNHSYETLFLVALTEICNSILDSNRFVVKYPFQEVSLLPQLAKAQPLVDKAKLKSASSIEDALEIARSSLGARSAV